MRRFEGGGRSVVDASVVVKWFVEEEYSRESKLLRDAYAAGLVDLSAPTILPYEVVNALKYSGAFNEEELKEVAKILTDLQIDLHGFEEVAEVIESFREHIVQSKWSELIRFVERRLARIERAGGSRCPVLYIGSTRNLAGRCRRLTRGGHTVFFALLPLLLNGWKIEYGYLSLKSPDKARRKEESLKESYRNKHCSNPPLTER